MATRNMVTQTRPKSSIHPAQARPLPQAPQNHNQREYERLLNNDARVAAQILNASKGKARERLIAIRLGLEEFRSGVSKLKQLSQEIDAEMFPKGTSAPGRSGTKRHLALAKQHNQLHHDLNPLHDELNERLALYAFRPCVTYIVTPREWRFGIVPDTKAGLFQMNLGPFIVTEADAAMSMVRLDASGDLNKVKLCEHCKQVWMYAKRPTFDRHCSTTCREASYKESREFLDRKKNNQRNYRSNQKRKAARAIANLKTL